MLTGIFNIYRITTRQIKNNHSLLFNLFPERVFYPQQIQSLSQKTRLHRLNIAIEYLNNPQIENKLNTIYELKQLADDNLQYHWLIMKALTDFVRNYADDTSQKVLKSDLTSLVREEIQAAITVIIERDTKQDPQNRQLDLSYADMRGANLQKANLEGANLYCVNLAGANLAEANLSGAILSAANLSGANLTQANLSGAILSAANLSGANLTQANLCRANLYLANLCELILNQTLLDGANLREAKFTLMDTTNSNL